MAKRIKRGIDWNIGEPRRVPGAVETFIKGQGPQIKALVIAVFALAIPIFIFYRGYFGALSVRTERSIIVTLVLCYTFLIYPLGKRSWNDRLTWLFAIDMLCFILAFLVGAYVIWGDTVIETDSLTVMLFGKPVLVDMIVGTVAIVLVLEATRRSLGWVLMAMPVVFILYSLISEVMPAMFSAPSIEYGYLIDLLFSQQEGIYGIGTHVLLTMVYLFLLFGVLLKETRIGAFFIALVNALLGPYTGGQPKVAVGASALMGTLSGSAIGNAATTGAITIPLMKKAGYEPEFAASIESVASNGGQILPPIMGASAFYIAANLGIPYKDLVLYASVPAMLYFICVFIIAHERSLRLGLKGMPREELPSAGKVLLEGGHLLIPLITIFYLLFAGYSITRVGCGGVLAVIIMCFVKKETRLGPVRFLSVLEEGARVNIPICVACILVGLIIGPIMSSGLGMRFSMLVLEISGGSVFVALILTAVLSIILGMGMPTLLVYITLVIFIIPALIELGVAPLTAHLFVLYFGIASGITPPVCLVAFAAAAIAGSSPMKTGWTSVRTGIASFALPFFFAYNPATLLQGFSAQEIGLAIFSGLVGMVLFATGVEGYFIRKLSVPERGLAFFGALASIIPGWPWKLTAFGLLIVVVVTQIRMKQRSQALA